MGIMNPDKPLILRPKDARIPSRQEEPSFVNTPHHGFEKSKKGERKSVE
jgi:hypothetical protein